jgi:hypothetical protein
MEVDCINSYAVYVSGHGSALRFAMTAIDEDCEIEDSAQVLSVAVWQGYSRLEWKRGRCVSQKDSTL